MGSVSGNNLLGTPETRLPAEPEVQAAVAAASDITELTAVVTEHPASALAWAALARASFVPDEPVVAYAFARVGYHRGLDALRRNGWKGAGPVPWSHEPNRGVLRALYELRRAAEAIGETDEVARLTDFLSDADETVIAQIETEDLPRDPAPPTEAFVIRGRD
ncbi:DUF3151 domain-containing protein [Mycetocola reblochoni]|uniref:DUF3151 domain-containing protein n=2 Tax=Mycetocola reblochoni TaxID=331618 RepID=A0A1R4IMY7_9MICO|nr:DUF3151 domain-containing protein [Mycetocola reblochoni]RLP67904.1 DUF3151 domain-containing protein [Mycetocola reblochoni]SJN21276.1 hypothetical protein FM119_02690 [Mycetocola reblochoni REB411]